MRSKRNPKLKIIDLVFYILVPAAIMYLFEAFTHNPFVRMKPGIQALNILLFILIETMLFFAAGRISTALRIMCAVFAVLGLTEYYLVEFRGVTLLPWDLGSLGTAAEVASGYDYMPGTRAILCILGLAVLAVICGFSGFSLKEALAEQNGRKRAAIRFGGAAASFFLICLYTLFVQTDLAVSTFGFYTKLFTPKAISERDGTLTAFLMELQYMNVRKPSGYSEEEAKSVLESFSAVPVSDHPANIIVIMNEAYSDLAVLGDFDTNEDYMPFTHSLLSSGSESSEVASFEAGWLNVSIVGGNTPNTEFEFLTGDSLLFLPEGSIPYQQYVREGIEAMPSYLKSAGYHTIGMHPYYSAGWERDRVYGELGFEESVFLDGFPEDCEKIRNYVSDMACSDEIIRRYEENKGSGRPLFLFLVTMQNHSPYDKDFGSLPVDIQIETDEEIKGLKVTERYLSLMKKSDEALKYLTDYFEKEDEDTVIVMFGDHQPSDSVVRPVLSLSGKDTRNMSDEDEAERYVVPYVIWTNFSTDELDGSGNVGITGMSQRETSANYLAGRVLSLSGAGSYPYREFVKSVEEKYPVLSAVRTVDAEGETLDDASIAADSVIEEYSRVQYMELFDHDDK